jgi:hypothetical protein
MLSLLPDETPYLIQWILGDVEVRREGGGDSTTMAPSTVEPRAAGDILVHADNTPCATECIPSRDQPCFLC